ncbi:hypothetical protein EDD85DRAFT_963208 [Armillaria nabsnona]|nr:hypothetical protein EDD85DRAFT_963208 [Armillaria nabsnona]
MLHFLGGPGKEYEIKVTEQDAKKYKETWKSSGGTSPACTLDEFSVFFQGPPASAWNKSAARVLTQHLMTQTYHYPDDDYMNRAILERACLAHIRTMCHTYKASLKPSNVQLKKQKDGNKASRKQKLWERRKKTALLQGGPTGIHAEALDLLGPESMSSDEESQDLC